MLPCLNELSASPATSLNLVDMKIECADTASHPFTTVRQDEAVEHHK